MQIHSLDVRTTPAPIAELDRLGDEIAELSAHLQAATARLLDLIREFDVREGWNTGFRSCAAWLSWRVGLVRVARALGNLPRLAKALARAEISYAKVRAVTRVATPETEERLLAVAPSGTAEHVERIVRGWRRVDRQAEAATPPGATRAARYRCIRTKPVRSSSGGGWSPRSARWSCRRWRRPASFSRRRRCTTASIRVRRASAIRSSSTSKRRCLRTRTRRASPSSTVARAFPRERRSAWRAMQAGW
jgi:hypothetical protein